MSFVPVEGQFYRIVAKHSGKVVEVRDNQIHNGTPIQQGTWADKHHQQFQFFKTGRFYNLRARSTGRALDVPGESGADGVGIIQWDWHHYSVNQQFEFLPAGGGAYYLGVRHSQKFLCIKGGSKDDTTPLIQHVWNGGQHFQFTFVPCEPIKDQRGMRDIVLRGIDPMRDSVLSLTGMIPTAGGGVKFLLGLFWPETDGSLVDQVRDYVRNIARQMIDEEFIKSLGLKMTGIKNVVRQYAKATLGADKGQWMTSMLEELEASQPYFFDERAPEKTLPHLLTLGSLHLSALRERYDNFEKLYREKPDDPAELLKDLQDRVKLYVDGAAKARQKTLDWRLGLISLSKEMEYQAGQAHHEVFIVRDSYDGYYRAYGSGRQDENRAQAEATLAERTRLVKEDFNAELDALFGSALAWQYINPAIKQQPVMMPVTLTSSLFGMKRGNAFDERDYVLHAPIKVIQIQFNDAGDRVLGLSIDRKVPQGPSAWGVLGLPATLRTHYLAPDEFITAAYGNHGGPGQPLYSLYFVTNKGHIVGGGRRDIGEPWGSEAPVGINARLKTISGWFSTYLIEGIVLKWMYERQE